MNKKKNITLTPEEQLLIVRLPQRLRGTWITWKIGCNPYFLMSRETYYRHVSELSSKYGIEIRQEQPHSQIP